MGVVDRPPDATRPVTTREIAERPRDGCGREAEHSDGLREEASLMDVSGDVAVMRPVRDEDGDPVRESRQPVEVGGRLVGHHRRPDRIEQRHPELSLEGRRRAGEPDDAVSMSDPPPTAHSTMDEYMAATGSEDLPDREDRVLPARQPQHGQVDRVVAHVFSPLR
jgi:hypothetical protein